MIHWLLRNNPDLLGDLLEERANGRSKAWLGRQVLAAVGRSMVDQGRRHPFVTLRAAAVSSAVYGAALAITLFVYGFVFGYFFPWSRSEYALLFVSVDLVPALLAGWVLARTHRACIEPAIVVMLVLYAVLAGPFQASDIATNVVGLLAGIWGGLRRHERPAPEGIS